MLKRDYISVTGRICLQEDIEAVTRKMQDCNSQLNKARDEQDQLGHVASQVNAEIKGEIFY